MRKSIYKMLMSVFVVVFMAATAYGANDISGHWAEATITQWINRGYISGYEDGSFRPNNPITRAEFTALVDRAFNKTASAGISFSDVNPSDWFYNPVARGVGSGYISGYSDNTFKPYNNITREEAAVIITRVLGETQNEQYGNSFSDSYLLSWSKGYVGKCVQLGIMKGDTDGSFRPQHNMTRAEAVTALNAGLNYYNNKTSFVPNPNDEGLVKVEDGTSTSKDGYTQISSSTYGPSSGKETIDEKVKITNSSATTRIKNVVFEDTVIVTDNVKRLYLDNVTADTLVVNGASYIYLTNCDIDRIEVDSNTSVTIENTSRSKIKDTFLYTKATLNNKYSSTSYGFKNVQISSSAAAKTTFSLRGTEFDYVVVDSERVTLNITADTVKEVYLTSSARNSTVNIYSGSTIDYANVDAKNSSLIGSGKIRKAAINASGVTLSRKPNNLTGSYKPYYERDDDRDYDYRYDYTFRVVNSQNVPVKGASVRVDGKTYTTGANGEATFRLDSGRYEYRITHSGFRTDTGTISASSGSGTYRLANGNTYNLSVTVTDANGVIVPDADVSISGYGNIGKTNASGIASRYVEPGYYTVTASKSGFKANSGTADIYTSAQNVTVKITAEAPVVTTGSVTFTVTAENPIAEVTGGSIHRISDGVILDHFNFGTSVTIKNLNPGVQNFTVKANYFTDKQVSVNVEAGVNKTETVTLTRTPLTGVTVKIQLDGHTDLDGFNAVLGGVSATTTNGVAEFTNVTPGDNISLAISKTGFEPINSSVNVVDYKAEQTFQFTVTEETPAPPQTYTLTVWVYDYNEGNGRVALQNAQVTLSGNKTDSGTTENNGGITFSNLFAGNYAVSVTVDGYVFNTGESDDLDNITITDGNVNVTAYLDAVVAPAGAPGDSIPENTQQEPANIELPLADAPAEMPDYLIDLIDQPVIAIDPPVVLPLPSEDIQITVETEEEMKVETPIIKFPLELIEKEVPSIEIPVKVIEVPSVEEKEEPRTEEPKTEIPVREEPKEEPRVEVVETGDVTFYVSGASNARVSFAGKIANANGSATFSGIKTGTYSYLVTADGYEAVSGSVTVKAGSNSVSVTLTPVLQVQVSEPQGRAELDFRNRNNYMPEITLDAEVIELD